MPPSRRSRSSSGSERSQAKYSGLTCSRTGLSNTVAGMNVTLIGRGRSKPGGRSYGRGRYCSKSSGRSAHTIFSATQTQSRKTPSRSESGSPVSGSIHHTRKSATQLSVSGLHVPRCKAGRRSRAVGTDQVEELMRRETRQFIATEPDFQLNPWSCFGDPLRLVLIRADRIAPRPAP